MTLNLFNSCVKFLSAPALKRLLTFHVAKFQSFFLFHEPLWFCIRRSGWLVALGFSIGNVFTEVGVSAPHSNPQHGGPGILLIGLSLFSRDDTALRRKIFTLTPLPLGLRFAYNVDKDYHLENFPVFNSGICSTFVPQLRLNYQQFTLLLCQLGLRPAMVELYYLLLLYIIDYYWLLFSVYAEELIYHNHITRKLYEKK